jgi:predicted Zn-ribbon and HTH transcriptional regulator
VSAVVTVIDQMARTYKDCLQLSRAVEVKQKGDKREALRQVNDIFEQAILRSKTLYSVVPDAVCRNCGGIILKKESIFPIITPGGNSLRGCPACNNMSYDLNHRSIIFTRK